VTDPQPDPLTQAAVLLAQAAEKEPGQAITARNDVLIAQVYALLSIGQSLQQLAANSTPPETEPTDEPDPATELPS
jgi:hypothetical protein